MVIRTAEADINRAPAPERSEPSLGTLFAEMTDQVSILMRREVELARVETGEKIATAVRSAASMIGGGVIASAGLIVLLLGIAYGLAAVMDLWISMLIVGIITLITGGLMFMAGRSAMNEVNFVPEKTIKSVQNNMDMIKEQVQ
jgi:hypothetical protein